MNDLPKVIGLSGPAKSGKDTLAKVLMNLGWHRVAFADALKSDIMKALISSYAKVVDLPYEGRPTWSWFTDPERKEQIRPLLVEFGRGMRNLDPLYWLKRAERDYMNDVNSVGGNSYVITDVRYANEADWIRDNGGVVISLSRDGVVPNNPEEESSLSKIQSKFHFNNTGNSIPEVQMEFRNYLVEQGIISLELPPGKRGSTCR